MKVLVKEGRASRVCSDSYFLMLSSDRCLCNMYMTSQLFPLQILKTYIGMCTLSVFQCLYFADDQHKYISNLVMIYYSCNPPPPPIPPKGKMIGNNNLVPPGSWRVEEGRGALSGNPITEL